MPEHPKAVSGERFHTPAEVAERLHVHVVTVRKWIKDKELEAYDLGGTYRVSETALLAFVDARRAS
jgi:excisionase family DNA binding protein